jgi:hypothetical protein
MQEAAQQPLIEAIRNDDSEQLAELFTTATDVEKMNAALFAAYSDKMTMLEPLIASGTNINQADRGGVTCLHWAVCRHNLPMMKLLLQHGAEHKADKEGDTPADYAEDRGYTDAFNLLVQHFLVAPIKLHDQDELVDDDVVLEEIETEQQISAKVFKLLRKLHIQKSDLDAWQVEWEGVERILNPHFLRQVFRFFVSTSVARTVLLWPFLSRNSIKLYDHEREKKSVRALTEDVSDSEDGRLLTLPDDAEDLLDTEGDAFIEDGENKEAPQLSVQADLNTTEISIIPRSRRCRFPVLTTRALLFESETTQQIVHGLTAFQVTAEESFDGIWSLLWSTLLAQRIAYFYMYPGYYTNAWQILLFELLFVFDQYNTFRGWLRSYDRSSNHLLILARSLTNPYVLSCVLGIPALIGMINGIRTARDSQTLGTTDVKQLIQTLKQYKPGFFADGLGWIVTAALPDAFPLFAMCSLLPQPAIKQALEKITRHVMWDGQLSAETRLKLFEQLYRFAHHRSQFTQLKALWLLAKIVDGIDPNNLLLLQEEGVDADNIKALLSMKTRGSSAIEYLANYYNLPPRHNFHLVPKSVWRPLFRYVYCNYLLWNMGYPQKWYLQPLFFAYRSVRLYITAIFYVVFLPGILRFAYERLKNSFCRQFSDSPNFRDDHYYAESLCFTSYLYAPRTFEQLISAIESIQTYYPWLSVNPFFSEFQISLDLSAQKKLIQDKKLPEFLDRFGEIVVRNNMEVSSFTLADNRLSLSDMQAIGRFVGILKNRKGKENFLLGFSRSTIAPGGISSLTKEISFSDGSSLYPRYLQLVLTGAQLTEVDISSIIDMTRYLDKLDLKGCHLSPQNCLALAKQLLQEGYFVNLNLADNSIDSECIEVLTRTQFGRLDLSGSYMEEQGIQAMARNLNYTKARPYQRVSVLPSGAPTPRRMDKNELIVKVAEDGFRIYYFRVELGISYSYKSLNSKLIQQNIIPYLPEVGQYSYNTTLIALIKSLCKDCDRYEYDKAYSLFGYNISDVALMQLFDALPSSQITTFDFTDKQVIDQRHYAKLMPLLVAALNRSSVRNLRWTSSDDFWLKDEGAKLFAKYLLQVPKHTLNRLDLSNNQIGFEGMAAISQALISQDFFSGLPKSLVLNNNQIGSGITSLAQAIVAKVNDDTSCKKGFSLGLSHNHITTKDFQSFIQILKNSTCYSSLDKFSISGLNFANNPIGDEGVIELMKFINSVEENRIGSTSYSLNLGNTNISGASVDSIIKILSLKYYLYPNHPLWIEKLIGSDTEYQYITIDLSNNALTDVDAKALCRAATQNGRSSLVLTGNPINESILKECSTMTSGSASWQHYSPYVFLFRFYRFMKDSISDSFLNRREKENTPETQRAAVVYRQEATDSNPYAVAKVDNTETFEENTSILYAPLLTVCEVFLQSMHQSAWLTAIPLFAGELLSKTGGYTQAEIEKLHQEIQLILLTSISNSPYTVAASMLARWLANHLAHSPRVASQVMLGTSMVMGVLGNYVMNGASLSWIMLQTGVALMGSVAGSLGVQKLPDVGRWGFNQAASITGYLGSRISFWSSSAEPSNIVPTDRAHAPGFNTPYQ